MWSTFPPPPTIDKISDKFWQKVLDNLSCVWGGGARGAERNGCAERGRRGGPKPHLVWEGLAEVQVRVATGLDQRYQKHPLFIQIRGRCTFYSQHHQSSCHSWSTKKFRRANFIPTNMKMFHRLECINVSLQNWKVMFVALFLVIPFFAVFQHCIFPVYTAGLKSPNLFPCMCWKNLILSRVAYTPFFVTCKNFCIHEGGR